MRFAIANRRVRLAAPSVFLIGGPCLLALKPHTANSNAQAPESLALIHAMAPPIQMEPGFIMFPTPRDADPPGTIFRIDAQGVRSEVADISRQLSITVNSEADWSAVESKRRVGEAKISLRRLFAGRVRAGAEGNIDHEIKSDLSLKGVSRERTRDTDVDTLLPRALRNVSFRPNNTYWLIRETISAKEISYTFSDSSLSAASAEGALAGLASAGLGYKWIHTNENRLVQRFPRAYRVLYKAEILRRVGGDLGGGVARIERDSIEKIPIWSEPDSVTRRKLPPIAPTDAVDGATRSRR